MASLRTLDEALELILERARPLPAEPVPISNAWGRVVAEAALARVDLPPFASSDMDGFAVRAQDTPGRLAIEARIAAGAPLAGTLGAGAAAGIATGAEVPGDVDAVVPVELAAEADGHVVLPAAEAGAHVRPRGGDVRAGAA